MKIDEAIEILQERIDLMAATPNRRLPNAMKLGIEALEAIKCGREGLRTEFFTPLLGEDKE